MQSTASLYCKVFSLNLPVTFCNSKIDSVGKAFITVISTFNGCCFFCCYQTLIMIGGKFIPLFLYLFFFVFCFGASKFAKIKLYYCADLQKYIKKYKNLHFIVDVKSKWMYERYNAKIKI